MIPQFPGNLLRCLKRQMSSLELGAKLNPNMKMSCLLFCSFHDMFFFFFQQWFLGIVDKDGNGPAELKSVALWANCGHLWKFSQTLHFPWAGLTCEVRLNRHEVKNMNSLKEPYCSIMIIPVPHSLILTLVRNCVGTKTWTTKVQLASFHPPSPLPFFPLRWCAEVLRWSQNEAVNGILI